MFQCSMLQWSKIHHFEFLSFFIPSVTRTIKMDLMTRQMLKFFKPFRITIEIYIHSYIHALEKHLPPSVVGQ